MTDRHGFKEGQTLGSARTVLKKKRDRLVLKRGQAQDLPLHCILLRD